MSRAPSMPMRRGDGWLALLLGAGLFTVYALGACRTIYVGDSGELTTAVAVLGIPHPTGYPLYVLLGKLWTLAVPAGSVAFRMSLFSALFAALASSLLFLLGRRIGLEALPSLFGAALLAFAPSYWGEANVQRVYSLNAAFVIAGMLAAVAWHERRDDRRLALVFFVCGLGAANHTFMVIFSAAFGGWALIEDASLRRRPRSLATAAAAFAAGLLPYAYLPLRSRFDPPLDWGNPETVRGFLDVVLRRGFWERAYLETPADLLAIAADFLVGIAREITLPGAALAIVGLVARPRRRVIKLALLVALGNFAAMALHGSRSDLFIWHRYDIPSYAAATLCAAVGWQALLAWSRLEGAARRLLATLALILPALLFVRGRAEFDRSRYRIAEDFAKRVLASLPPGAHLAATDDNVLFVLLYLHLAEGLRPDVDLIQQGVGSASLPPLRFNPDRDPIFFTHHPNWSHPGLEVAPVGVVFRIIRSGAARPEPVIIEGSLDGESDPRVPKDYLTRNLIGHFHYMLGFSLEERDWRRASEEFARAATASPDNDVLFYNLGLIFRRNGLLPEAIAAFRRCNEINPRHLPSASAPRAADRVSELEAEEGRLAALEQSLASDPELAAGPSSSAAYHRRLGELFAARGETLAARGQRLRAVSTSPYP